MFAYNKSRQESTKHTPFEIMFGGRATLPIDISMTKDSAEDLACLSHEFDGDVYQLQQKTRLDVMVSAKRNYFGCSKRQKQYYDAKRANPHY